MLVLRAVSFLSVHFFHSLSNYSARNKSIHISISVMGILIFGKIPGKSTWHKIARREDDE
jgi:hypothetical protein